MNVSWGARGQVGVNNAPVEIAENVVGRERRHARRGDGAAGRAPPRGTDSRVDEAINQ